MVVLDPYGPGIAAHCSAEHSVIAIGDHAHHGDFALCRMAAWRLLRYHDDTLRKRIIRDVTCRKDIWGCGSLRLLGRRRLRRKKDDRENDQGVRAKVGSRAVLALPCAECKF